MDPRPSARRLPTSVLVLATLALLAMGGTWWFGTQPRSAAPAPAATAPPSEDAASSVMVLQMGDGTIVVDETGVTTFYRGMRQKDTRFRPILGGPLPCRIGSGGLAEALEARVSAMPLCSRPRR
jgi:hypothetical protein